MSKSKTEGDVEKMWRSDSDAESDDDVQSNAASYIPDRQRSVSIVPESFSDVEINALYEISRCYDPTISRLTHEAIFRFPRSVLGKMVEVGALTAINSKSLSFQVKLHEFCKT